MYISICKNYDPKQSKEYNNTRVAHGWELREFDWKEEEIIKLTTEFGISGNEYEDGHKCNDSWTGTHAIMLDFDDGEINAAELLETQKDWKHDSYVFSSQNHRRKKINKNGKIEPVQDRLRTLIPLAEPITKETDRKTVEEVLASQYNRDGKRVVDKTFMGRSRYFAHGTNEVSSFVGGEGPLDWRSLLQKKKKTKKKRISKAEWLKNTFRLSDIVRDRDGNQVNIKDIKPGSPIFCPICGDAEFRSNKGNHNAVLRLNDDGIHTIYCSSCDYRSEGLNGSGVYNLHPDDIYGLKSKESEVTVFIDTRTSTYRSLCNEPGMDEPVIRLLTTLNHVEQFNKSQGLPNPEVYSRARLELHPEKDDIINLKEGYVNKYMAPQVLKTSVPDGHVAKLPYYTGKIIDHVLAHDKEIKEHFYNDLAHLVQTRQKMITTYLLQGVEGTGKGFFFSRVLRPIFGERYCTSTDQDAFGGQFNGFLEDNVLVLVNEVSGNFSTTEKQNLSTIEKMKIAITDEYIQIEGKHRDRFNGRNCCSFLFATNRHHGVVLSKNDRRFNVAPRQEVKIDQTDWWPGYDRLKELVADELQEFVLYFKQYPVDKSRIGKVIDNEPKRVLQALSRSNAEDFFDAVNRGDLDWIHDNMVMRGGYNASEKHSDMIMLANSLKGRKDPNGKGSAVSMKDLCTLYNYINHKDLPVNTFGKLAAGYLPRPKAIKVNNQTIWGIQVNWQGKKGLFD